MSDYLSEFPEQGVPLQGKALVKDLEQHLARTFHHSGGLRVRLDFHQVGDAPIMVTINGHYSNFYSYSDACTWLSGFFLKASVTPIPTVEEMHEACIDAAIERQKSQTNEAL